MKRTLVIAAASLVALGGAVPAHAADTPPSGDTTTDQATAAPASTPDVGQRGPDGRYPDGALYHDKHLVNDGRNAPAPPRSTPSQESLDWVAAHTFVAPDEVAMGNTGITPGPTTWWTWNGPVECAVMPVDGACPTTQAPKATPTAAAKPTVKPVAKAARRVVARAAVRPAATPAAKPAVKPSAKPAAKPAVKPVVKPVAKAAVPTPRAAGRTTSTAPDGTKIACDPKAFRGERAPQQATGHPKAKQAVRPAADLRAALHR